MIYLDLFKVFFMVGLLGFGGGYASSALIQEYVVERYGWLTMQEFTNVLTISEMTPGPIGINIASFVGVQIGGILGTVVATLSYILPALIILTLLSYIYVKLKNLSAVQTFLAGLRPAVCAMIGAVGIRLFVNAIWGSTISNIDLSVTNFIAFGMFAVLFVLLRTKKITPIPAIFASGFVGALLYWLI